MYYKLRQFENKVKSANLTGETFSFFVVTGCIELYRERVVISRGKHENTGQKDTIRSVWWEYSCFDEYLEEFNMGKY